MKPILDKKLREQELEEIFRAPPLLPSARAEMGECPPGMRPIVWEAYCESVMKHDALYRALRVSGD